MMNSNGTTVLRVLRERQEDLLRDWVSAQLAAVTLRRDLISEGELGRESRDFLQLLAAAASHGDGRRAGEEWDSLRALLAELTRTRALKGFSPAETASFVFSLKQPLFTLLQAELRDEPKRFTEELWQASVLLDDLGLYVTEMFQKSRESIIARQQQEMMELSTPVVQLWTGILAVPLIGTLDSARTQVVMETLLQRIVDTGSQIAIIDITGVPTVDTLVAQHLLKTVAATRLMGAECIISGIRPQIAQTIVHLGVELEGVVTKASLSEAFRVALARSGCRIESAR
jgi:rsbT co-antagonist protein RsbR